jgi:hypothetical protein
MKCITEGCSKEAEVFHYHNFNDGKGLVCLEQCQAHSDQHLKDYGEFDYGNGKTQP